MDTTPALLRGFLEGILKRAARDHIVPIFEVEETEVRFCELFEEIGVNRTEPGRLLVELGGQHCIPPGGPLEEPDCSRPRAVIQFEMVPVRPQEVRLTGRCFYAPLVGLYRELLNQLAEHFPEIESEPGDVDATPRRPSGRPRNVDDEVEELANEPSSRPPNLPKTEKTLLKWGRVWRGVKTTRESCCIYDDPQPTLVEYCRQIKEDLGIEYSSRHLQDIIKAGENGDLDAYLS